jgi:transposase InsO family protein
VAGAYRTLDFTPEFLEGLVGPDFTERDRRRFVRALRLLDENERHLRAVLAEVVRYDNLERPHRTLHLETPVPRLRARAGPIRLRPVLGGLHHAYERAA